MGHDRRLVTGILTSSRADYGIYLPLLKALQKDSAFDVRILVFGTHLSKRYGMNVNQIISDGYDVFFSAHTTPDGDSPSDLGFSMSKTIREFTALWSSTHFDIVFALGDRYEMFAAVASTAPFNIPVAHIHGGETTLGAIDNAFRHSITTFSKLHFTSTGIYKTRVAEIKGTTEGVFNVGALSIDNLKSLKLLDTHDFMSAFGIDLNHPTILFTFHPETVDFSKNELYIGEIVEALQQLGKYQIIITMPNADTMGLLVREKLTVFGKERPGTWLIESFGTLGYLSAMKHCAFIMGNSSSGFVEAAFFPKKVINLGDRQKGRILTKNIIQSGIEKKKILEAVGTAERTVLTVDCNVYGDGTAADRIVEIIKGEFARDDRH